MTDFELFRLKLDLIPAQRRSFIQVRLIFSISSLFSLFFLLRSGRQNYEQMTRDELLYELERANQQIADLNQILAGEWTNHLTDLEMT